MSGKVIMIILGGIIFVLSGCFFEVPKPILDAPCDVITASQMRNLIQDIGDGMDLPTIEKEILTRFELNEDELRAERGEGHAMYEWDYEGIRHRTSPSESDSPFSAVFFDHAEPRLSRLVNCLGEPGWYQHRVLLREYYELSLDVWFPEHGLLANSSQIGLLNTIVVDENLSVDRLSIVAPGTIEDVTMELYVESDRAQKIRNELRPWPGSLGAAVKEIRSELCVDHSTFCDDEEVKETEDRGP